VNSQQHVVIIGGGFGGLYTARALSKANVQITLVDRRNFHLFQPLLYQVATGALSPANIAAPLRSVLRRQKNARVIMDEVTDIDVAGHTVKMAHGELKYDALIVATGARHHYFGHPEWEQFAPGLKTIEDATRMRRQVLLAFEQAEREPDPIKQRALLTFVVVGGGPTGVELAGSLGEMAHKTLRHDFRVINPAGARILLLEAGPKILPSYVDKLSTAAADDLKHMGVEIQTGTAVTNIQPGEVTVKCGDKVEVIPCHTILWGAGVQASPLGRLLCERTGTTQVDRMGRVIVQPDLTLKEHPEIFVIGDLACFIQANGTPLPGVAPVAMQMGGYVARLIVKRQEGKSLPPFEYKDKGSMATIGRASAIADMGKMKLTGYLAWLAWLFIHLLYLIEFQNRFLVMAQWAWNYFTRGRSARLITEVPVESTL